MANHVTTPELAMLRSQAMLKESTPKKVSHQQERPSKILTLQQHVPPIVSCLSGAVAGAVEAACTYPFEFAKTRLQLGSSQCGPQISNPVSMIRHLIASEGVRSLYVGCSTLMAGTALKAGVRFLSFDAIKAALSDNDGRLTVSRSILAGMFAGCVESVTAVTPTERIKTAMIDDARGAKRYRSAAHATGLLVKEQGLSGLYKGLGSTTMKQCATSAVRMGSYNTMKQASQSYGLPQNSATTFGMGALAGTITVYASQPFDTIKSRTQSARGASTTTAVASIWRDGGVKGFWKGSTMRLGRLVFSGGIVFTVYEKVSGILTPMMR
ncbi:tricarboxylate transport protein, mitochondrial precursor [Dichotomopilus funicola]|uniref:Tricarboxylate transport protein, mitochondrial n=1 Tax=Dichotomopilus funicola TaxID=1934379 RepID=A0AAN6V4P3_9PEZI|nr:tricarboxylate transport protein, mitochondrial precursor [Dichotomopilus funicola]